MMKRVPFLSVGMLLVLLGACQLDGRGLESPLEIDRGLTLWLIQPSAVHFTGEFDRTYVGYLDLDRNVRIAAFDHETSSKLPSQKLKEWPVLDDHGAPAIWVKRHGPDRGRLLAFYCLHASPLYARYSSRAESLDAWSDEMQIDEGRCTYPAVAESSEGRLFLFYTLQENDQRRFVLRTSDDAGDTWSLARTLIDFGKESYPYVIRPVVREGNIHLAWTVYMRIAENPGHRNVYYAVIGNDGNTWSMWNDPAGSSRSLPITGAYIEPLYEPALDRETSIWDMKLGASGEASILFVDHARYTAADGWSDSVAYEVALRGPDIRIQEISAMESFVYPAGAIYAQGPEHRVITNQAASDGSSLLVELELVDGSWTRRRLIARTADGTLMNPVRTVAADSEDLWLTWLKVKSYFNKEYDAMLMAK